MDETTLLSFEAGMIMENQNKITTITSFDSDLNFTLLENTTQKQLPIDMRFNNGHLLAVIVYPILMFVSAVGNLAVLSSIVRYWFDKPSAQEVDQVIQKGFFLFACTNSCVNPLIYGLFHFRKGQKVETSSRSANTNNTLS
ncbi:unnamed protein product [Orchesella dallaii]|uniref:G-protein coupled receptors family 1 profile domain-containing protein n=1 Tax=Orchesella dallaii TaxID=48710 RepID=A0ABP1PIR0_9HEXA